MDPKIISVALSGLENILKLGHHMAQQLGNNPYAIAMEECGGEYSITSFKRQTINPSF